MKKIWDAEELAAVWSLNHDEMKLLKTKPPRNHLGFAAQLKFYRFSGRFLQNSSEISDTPLQYLAEQLNVTASDIEAYDFANRSGKRHRSEILTFLGVQRVTASDKNDFSDWLIREIFPQGADIEEATELSFNWFAGKRIESPAKAELDRLSRSAFNQFEKNLFAVINQSLSARAKEKLNLCLDGFDGVVEFGNLKADPGVKGQRY